MIQIRQIRAHLHPLSCRNTLKTSCQSHQAQSSTHHHPVSRVVSLRYPCMIILDHYCTFQGLIVGKSHSRLAVIEFYSRRFWFYRTLSLFIQKLLSRLASYRSSYTSYVRAHETCPQLPNAATERKEVFESPFAVFFQQTRASVI